MTVVVCSACARYVRDHEARCPFCNSPREPEHRNFPLAKLTRAALVAMGALGGLEACETRAPTAAPDARVEAPTVQSQSAVDVAELDASTLESDGEAPSDAAADASESSVDAAPDARAVVVRRRPRPPVIRASAPMIRYGAPPAPSDEC